MIELLAPAGSMESLRAAVQNGANAVYLGCGTFNARQSAKNFTPQTLTEAIKYCHVRGVAVHLTLNTLVSDREAEDCQELIQHAASNGIDAFIVQDLGVLQMCRRLAPSVPVHASTQMSIHNLQGVQLCAAMGISRVVLSRELSREEIRHICKNSPIEIEVFGHGALCMCYSGQCYMSAVIGQRSGNRGRCAQPCRQCYGYGRREKRNPLSLKDNCLVSWLRELDAMGVVSLKIEGRMKRPEYVASVVNVYRRALDTDVVTQEMRDELMTAFNRQGFTDGYYTGELGRNMFGIHEDKPEDNAWLRRVRQSYEGLENPLVPVRFHAVVNQFGSTLTVTDPEGRSCTVRGPVPEIARSQLLTDAQMAKNLSKTGGTPYYVELATADIEPGLMLSVSAINAMRRDALNQLTALRGRREEPRMGSMRRFPYYDGKRARPELTIQVTSREQITPKLLNMNPVVLYVPLHILCQAPEMTRNLLKRVNVAAVLPRVAHDDELPAIREGLQTVHQLGVKEALVGNLSLMSVVKEAEMEIRSDFGLNVYNSLSMQMMRHLDVRSATLSFEMTLSQVREVSKPVDCELLGYGRLPLMVTENCLIKGKTGQCACHMGPVKLVDKTGAEFPVLRDGKSCRSVLYNGKKLNCLDKQAELNRLGLWAVRLMFTTENANEVDRVLAACVSHVPFDPGSCTRGLYWRGVE